MLTLGTVRTIVLILRVQRDGSQVDLAFILLRFSLQFQPIRNLLSPFAPSFLLRTFHIFPCSLWHQKMPKLHIVTLSAPICPADVTHWPCLSESLTLRTCILHHIPTSSQWFGVTSKYVRSTDWGRNLIPSKRTVGFIKRRKMECLGEVICYN